MSFLLWMLDSLAEMLPDGARAGADQPVAAGPLHAIRDWRDVHLGPRLLRQHAPCWRCSSRCARWHDDDCSMEHGAIELGKRSAGSSAGSSPRGPVLQPARGCRCSAGAHGRRVERLRAPRRRSSSRRWRHRPRQRRAGPARRPHRPHAREDLHALGAGDDGRRRPRAAGAPDLLQPWPGSGAADASRMSSASWRGAIRCSKCASSIPTASRRWRERRHAHLQRRRSWKPTDRKFLVQTTDENRDRDRHPARAAREGGHRVLRRGARRAADGQLRVPHPRRRCAGHSHDDASSSMSRCRTTASVGCAAHSRRRATRRKVVLVTACGCAGVPGR